MGTGQRDWLGGSLPLPGAPSLGSPVLLWLRPLTSPLLPSSPGAGARVHSLSLRPNGSSRFSLRLGQVP